MIAASSFTAAGRDCRIGAIAIKEVHLRELRTAVNALRAAAGLTATSFTDTPAFAFVTAVRAIHIQELRTSLDAARNAIGLAAIAYADPSLAAGTPVRASHVTQLRNGTQ